MFPQLNPSKVQEQFWLATNMYQNNLAYNVPLVFVLNRTPNIINLEKSLHFILEHHEALRASFSIVNGNLNQTIANPEESKIQIKIKDSNEPFSERALSLILELEANYAFDLSKFPLLRVKLIQFSDSKAVLAIQFHHILIDLAARDIFLENLSTYYNDLENGRPLLLEKAAPQYSDYIDWENEWLNSDKSKVKIENWLKKYNNPVELLNLPYDKQKAVRTTPAGKHKVFTINKETATQVKTYSQDHHISPFLFLFSCYSVLLHRLSNHDKIIVSVPFPNRNREADKSVIGCFVNNLPITIDFTNRPNFIQLTDQIRKEFLFVHRNQEVPLLEIINHINTGIDRSANPIFQVGFTQEPLPKLELQGINSDSVLVEKYGAQLELFLKIIELDDELTLSFEYNSDLFEETTINHWTEIYKEIVTSCINAEELEIGRLDILPGSEKEQIRIWNQTTAPYEKDTCIHQKLEQLSSDSPNLAALRFGNSVLTYKELNDHSNRLANYLIKKGVCVGDIIAVCIDRSFEMMVGIFATLKAGATYLPLDSKNPQNRLSEIIGDAKPKIILTDSKSDLNLPPYSTIIYTDNILTHPLTDNSTNPETKVESNNLAYIIYTSGSTGKPKGVMIEHHSLMNRLNWMQKQFPIASNDVLLQKTSITFDVSVWELFWWTFSGASLAILPPGSEREPAKIVQEIETKKVSVIHFVPSMFSVFIDYLKSAQVVSKISGLKWIIASGEALQPKTVNEFNKLRSFSKLPEVVNLYGPTEATIDVSIYRCPLDSNIKEIPIGKTIDNTQLYVLNKANQIQPWGIPGELVIGGVNLARGYINNPELTELKFPEIEIESDSKKRFYRTGDLAKWNSDGNIVFIGRMDNQIKIRGFRIELGEIEAKLLEYPKIKEASVMLQIAANENPLLKAFVVLFPDEKTNSGQIKKYLVELLPAYMLPNQIFILDQMPISQNGKIDRKQLIAIDTKIEEPVNTNSSVMEQNISNIFTELLGIKCFRNADNFFDLGGNSLMAIRLTNMIYEKYNIKLEVVKIFEYPSIKDLARYLSSINNDTVNDSPVLSGSRRSLKYAHQVSNKRKS